MSRNVDEKVFTPSEIEKRSFEIIESEVPEPRPYQGDQWLVVRRMIHSTADFDLLNLVRFHPLAIDAGIKALRSGCRVVTDTEMARSGITVSRMKRLGCKVQCYINHRDVVDAARRQGTTRSRAAMDFACGKDPNGIYVVGNAPTALLRLVQLMEQGQCRPSLIVGMPVGFVNVIESKERLMKQDRAPYITLEGRKGGSALAASVVNQLAIMALR